MGINNLKKFIRDKYPSVIKTEHFTEFSQKKIAVDISSYIYKYKSIAGDDWFGFFPNLICNFRKHDVHGVFIFDGKPPKEKELEAQKRKKSRENTETNVFNASFSLDRYIETKDEPNPVIDDCLVQIMDKIRISDDKGNVNKITRFLRPKSGKNGSSYIDVDRIREWIDKKEKQLVNISKQEIEDVKTLLSLFGVPYLQAEGEAEALGCYLYSIGKIDGILTEDTDVLTYGAKIYISNLDSKTGVCDVIYLDELLEELNYNQDEFRDFCIMCGTDYNNNMNGYGCVKVKKIIDEHRNIDTFIEKDNELNKKRKVPLEYDVLKHKRSRELFVTFGELNIETNNHTINYWEMDIDFEKIREFLKKKKCMCFIQLEKLWMPSEIEFEDD